MSEYPEHEKLQAVKDQSQAIGEFLDFSKFTLCEYRECNVPQWIHEETGEAVGMFHPRAVENFDWFPSGFYPTSMSIVAILADWFGIDLDRLEQEKRAMLGAMRATNEARR